MDEDRKESKPLIATHVILGVADIDACCVFYAKFLGAEPTIAKPRWCEFDLPGIRFCLENSDSRHGSGMVLALRCEQLDTQLKRLAKACIAPSSEPRIINEDDGTKVRWFVFSDPEGNPIGLYGT